MQNVNSSVTPTGPAAAWSIRRRWMLIGGSLALVLAVALGAWVIVGAGGKPLSIDSQWMNQMLAIRSPVLDVPALALNYLGGGIMGIFIVPIAIIAVLLLFRRPWAAGYFLTATLLGAGLVQLLKHLLGRARPEDILVHADFGSYPSGHVTNAAIMATTLAIIFPRLWVVLVGAAYTALMMLSRTYLGAHWLSDTIGGLLAGVGLAVLLGAFVVGELERENARSAERRQSRRLRPAA